MSSSMNAGSYERRAKAAIRSVMPESLVARCLVGRNLLADWKHKLYTRYGRDVGALTPETRQYLTRNNPTLTDIQRRYSQQALFTHTFWKTWHRHVDLQNFRGEGHYLSQRQGMSINAYLASAVYAETVDEWNLIHELKEDGLFGCHCYTAGGNGLISRDLIDSVLEIKFVRSCLGILRTDAPRVLDIGAGYGRFAHRFLTVFPRAAVTNLDGIAESTFLCDFYSRFRALGERSVTIPIDRLDQLAPDDFDLCVNIHSWSECARQTVKYWMRLLQDLRVRHLFVVPHDEHFTTREPRGRADTFLPDILEAGYRVVRRDHKFEKSSILRTDGVAPAWYWLFERS